jgi:hypothetical protein
MLSEVTHSTSLIPRMLAADVLDVGRAPRHS